MKSIKTKLLVIMLITTMLMVTACGSNDDPIVIGNIGPMTGDYSMYGVSVANGAALAVEEINAAGGVLGRDIEVISYDSKGDGVEGVNAYNRLRDQDGMVGLVGATFSGVTLAIKEIAIEDGIPMLTPTATHADVTKDAPNVFRACYTDTIQGATAAQFAGDTLDAKTAAVLYNVEDPYSEGLAIAFQESFDGEVLLYEGYSAADVDFKSYLTKVQSEDPDVIFLPDYIAKVGIILSQLDEIGLDTPCVGVDGWDGIEVEYADVAEGHYFLNHYANTDPDPLVQDFVNNYKAKFEETPSALAALGYDSVYAMANAIEAAGEIDNALIVEALAATDMDAVAGHITFDEIGDPKKAITVIQVVDGLHVVADKVTPN